MTAIRLPDQVAGLSAGDAIMASEDDPVEVDLSRVAFVAATGLLSLTTACLEQLDQERDVAITPPESVDAATYLIRVGFRDLLRDAGATLPEPFASRTIRKRELPGSLLELQTLTGDADPAGERLYKLGLANGIPDEVLERGVLAWSEAVDNAFMHSASDVPVTVAQRYRDPGGTRLEIGVGDIGMGIRRSLQKKYRPRSDTAALMIAVTPGRSRLADRHRGYGLVRAAEATKGRGSFEIRSGTASVVVGREPRTHAVPRAGVLVAIRMSVSH